VEHKHHTHRLKAFTGFDLVFRKKEMRKTRRNLKHNVSRKLWGVVGPPGQKVISEGV
jgi:hypothetical protein